jgi:5-methyltetrahydrofolate--homocysteine methyltransferase
MDHGIPREDVLIDPLVMPIGAMRTAGRQVFEIVRRCRDELKVNTCCGASNVSFGLPNRGPLNGTFLAMAIGAGLTSAITNPIEEHIKTAIMAADVMTGNDENCLSWIMANRAPQPEGEAAGRRERRVRRG